MKIPTKILAPLMLTLFLAGCQGSSIDDMVPNGANTPIPPKLVKVMKTKGMTTTSPIMVRIFKEENVLEIWKQKDNGRYDMVTSYQICKWSGKLGPKFIEGDRQAPEGFYAVRPAHMNPKSNYYLSFDTGFPNALDRALGRTGANLMVHGACSSSGCYSMTDAQVAQIYAFARDAFKGGQQSIQLQAFPFRMTAANMARYKDDPNYAFWKNLKEGYDHFEITKVPPKVDVCEKKYVFNHTTDPNAPIAATSICPPANQPESLRMAYQSYQSTYESAFSSMAGKGKTQPPSRSIKGLEEARIIADWSARRARGERVTMEPPSLSPQDEGSASKPQVMVRLASAVAADKAKEEKEGRRTRMSRPASQTAATTATPPGTSPQTTASIAPAQPAQTQAQPTQAQPTQTPAPAKKAWWKIMGE
ncbi:murein L,D-transpeptidase [Phyllobacterium sp. 21LDTY02-6]|uniref:L,D-transpeptidase family protein n=1 Tax=Phyllobacterium sp. 21LDTY02-6 TaxID=2944903 RepID=UPI00201FC554|nr:murein L,D-transpeptidase family protein [Phyllobacterium sp. 21LDTY02-6]MCO4317701.1 murein L,D-transpeptidase [Phyllobacterium sp. 21LDTY02-6]